MTFISHYCNTSQRGIETRATCCTQQFCNVLRWNVTIVLLEKNQSRKGNLGVDVNHDNYGNEKVNRQKIDKQKNEHYIN